MKLNILSDLHVGLSEQDTPLNDSDVVVVAGDIAPPRQAAQSALRLDKPFVYVLGKHEFYGSSIEAATADLKRLCAGTPVHVLNNDDVIIEGVRFVGSTPWASLCRKPCQSSQRRAGAGTSGGSPHPTVYGQLTGDAT